jgi:glycerate kinase
MKVVVAIDSLKDSLTSFEAGKAIEEGVRKAYGHLPVDIVVKPLADGGEGTVNALVEGLHGELRQAEVHGPLDERVCCPYGYLRESRTAVIEMAGAAGLGLVPEKLRNPLNTTTYGVGEVISQAMAQGVRNFIVGIGGSATSDCGIGMLQALGYIFSDADGHPVGLGGREAGRIAAIDDSQVLPAIHECVFNIACDVTNPLFGRQGAAYIFGPQKGAVPEIVETLDKGSRSFAAVTAAYLGKDVSQTAGAGAAGGLGFAFLAYLNGNLRSGIQIVLDSIHLAEAIKDADYVVTGEGRLDAQTAMGKAPIGVAKLAKQYGAKVIALAGCTTEDAIDCNRQGIDAFFSIVDTAMPLKEAMNKENALRNMTNTATQVFNLIRVAET